MRAPDTFPKLLLEHARLRPDRTANHEKDRGIWQTWAQVTAEVEAFADGSPDEVRSSLEVVAAYLSVAHGEARHPSPRPASGEREGPIASAIGG